MGVVSIQAGNYYCMAVTSLGNVWAWGVPEHPESLGFGDELSPSLHPQLVPALKNYNVSSKLAWVVSTVSEHPLPCRFTSWCRDKR